VLCYGLPRELIGGRRNTRSCGAKVTGDEAIPRLLRPWLQHQIADHVFAGGEVTAAGVILIGGNQIRRRNRHGIRLRSGVK
jgi:hypothetical protein